MKLEDTARELRDVKAGRREDETELKRLRATLESLGRGKVSGVSGLFRRYPLQPSSGNREIDYNKVHFLVSVSSSSLTEYCFTSNSHCGSKVLLCVSTTTSLDVSTNAVTSRTLIVFLDLSSTRSPTKSQGLLVLSSFPAKHALNLRTASSHTDALEHAVMIGTALSQHLECIQLPLKSILAPLLNVLPSLPFPLPFARTLSQEQHTYSVLLRKERFLPLLPFKRFVNIRYLSPQNEIISPT